jgi:CcmD family protein
MKNFEFLFWAYNVIWAGIALFIVLLLLRLRRVNQRVERLERAVAERDRSEGV